jgi:site-specific recombinase XerD
MTERLPDLAKLLPSWKLASRAERKSPATVKSYAEGVHAFLRWCESTGTPTELSKANAQAFTVDMLDRDQAPKTASTRLLGIRRFSDWLASKGELDTDLLVGVKQLKLDKKSDRRTDRR